MGLNKLGASLALLARARSFSFDRVLTLGRLYTRLSSQSIRQLEGEYGLSLQGLDSDSEPWSEAFFRRIGASMVHSLDCTDYEGAAITCDLNEPISPAVARPGYDVVFDGGTLEHVFHFPQALENALSLLKVGGAFLCTTGSDGWLGHGFYQFSPELFFRTLCKENGFEITDIFLAEYGDWGEGHRLFRLKDPALTGLRTSVPGTRPLMLLVCARKFKEVKRFEAWPQQSDYFSRWQAEAGKEPRRVVRAPTMVARVLKALLPAAIVKEIQRVRTKRRKDRESRAGWEEVLTLSQTPLVSAQETDAAQRFA